MINILFLLYAVWTVLLFASDEKDTVLAGFYSYFEPRFKVDRYRADA